MNECEFEIKYCKFLLYKYENLKSQKAIEYFLSNNSKY